MPKYPERRPSQNRRRPSPENFENIYNSSREFRRLSKKKPYTIKTRAIVLFISIVLLILASVFLYYFNIINSMNYDSLDGDNKTKEVSLSLDGNALLDDPNVLNVMLFGEDTRATATTQGRADTMILLSVDNRRNKVKLTSFLRDTYVYIPDHDWGKLNSSYSLGGASLSIATIETNYGINIDRYAIVDFKSFKNIINALGGIDINITGSEARYINAQIIENNQDCEYVDQQYCVSTYDENGDEIKQKVKLNGKQALWYSRDRGGKYNGEIFSGDDWTRTERQRNMMQALMTSVKGASLTDIVSIVNEIGPMVTTNVKKSEMTTLVASSLTYLKYDMEELHVPTDNTWSYGNTDDGQSIIQIDDWTQARKDLALFIYEDSIKTNTTDTTGE